MAEILENIANFDIDFGTQWLRCFFIFTVIIIIILLHKNPAGIFTEDSVISNHISYVRQNVIYLL